jgi:hypothetical protein
MACRNATVDTVKGWSIRYIDKNTTDSYVEVERYSKYKPLDDLSSTCLLIVVLPFKQQDFPSIFLKFSPEIWIRKGFIGPTILTSFSQCTDIKKTKKSDLK